MVSAYWQYMTRQKLNQELPTPFEMVPDFFLHTAGVSLFFMMVMYLIPVVMAKFYPNWYNTLNDRKKEELPAYLSSMIHHISVVPLAWHVISNDFTNPEFCTTPQMVIFMRFACPLCVGFVVADTFFYAIPLALRGNFEYIIHHALAIWMTVALLGGSGHLIRYFPHIIICDTTNTVFNFAWFLRLTGFKDTSLVTSMEMSFAVLFLLLRGINLSVVFGIMFFSEDNAGFGVGRWAFPLISLLQFWWLFKIAQAMAKKLMPQKDNAKKLE